MIRPDGTAGCAADALAEADLTPVSLVEKEGLALVNQAQRVTT